MKIVIDGFGGDNAPKEIVEGAIISVSKHPELELIICGDKTRLEKELAGRSERIVIEHAPDIITNDDVPTEAIRKKENSSLVRTFDILKNNDDVIAMVSAGSTGAILTGAIMKIGRIKGITRPALAPILPTKLSSKNVMIIDSGANVDCKPINLYHFALMGSAYYSIMFGTDKPKVGLLNVGIEEKKGTDLTREAYAMIKNNSQINFIGNVEAREFMSGNIEVMVSEGFAGNVLLKGSEGAVMAVMSLLKRSIKSHFLSKIGYVFMKKTFGELKDRMDVLGKHGGSPFLGCKKLVMKNHGSSGRNNIASSIDQAIKLYENKLIEKIETALEAKGE